MRGPRAPPVLQARRIELGGVEGRAGRVALVVGSGGRFGHFFVRLQVDVERRWGAVDLLVNLVVLVRHVVLCSVPRKRGGYPAPRWKVWILTDPLFFIYPPSACLEYYSSQNNLSNDGVRVNWDARI